jgi:hypothetical protein
MSEHVASIDQFQLQLGAAGVRLEPDAVRRPERRPILVRRNQSGHEGRSEDHQEFHGSNYPFKYFLPTVAELTVLANFLPKPAAPVGCAGQDSVAPENGWQQLIYGH